MFAHYLLLVLIVAGLTEGHGKGRGFFNFGSAGELNLPFPFPFPPYPQRISTCCQVRCREGSHCEMRMGGSYPMPYCVPDVEPPEVTEEPEGSGESGEESGENSGEPSGLPDFTPAVNPNPEGSGNEEATPSS